MTTKPEASATAQGATPGPWTAHGTKIIADTRYVATIDDWSNPDCAPQYQDINNALKAECEANAKLIAASPDLLAALKAIVAALSQPAQRTDLTNADRSRLAGVIQILRGDAVFAVNTALSAISKATEGRV